MVAFVAALLLPQSTPARDLVVTLKDGTRIAYPLTAQDKVKMLPGEEAFTLNGQTYQLANVKELRLFKQTPEGAIPVGVKDIHDALQIPADDGIYDLSGRKVAETTSASSIQQLKPGIYIINHQKVIIR